VSFLRIGPRFLWIHWDRLRGFSQGSAREIQGRRATVLESARPERQPEGETMSSTRNRFSLGRPAALVAMVVGVAGGSYGLASAATGTDAATTTTAVTAAAPTLAAPPGGGGQAPWGHQRSDETLLTGDALSKVTAIAESKFPGGTVVRVETDADGVATYEAHMTKADGSPVTVYVDSAFQFVSSS
jgi:hypothetical protein